MTRQKRIDRNLLYVFLSVPLLSSIMSAIHLVNMVELGNPMFMAVALAITFELGSIVSFIAMSKSILKRLKKESLYFIFTLLFLLQAFGNVYSSFDYIRRSLIVDPTWLDSFREMFFNVMDVTTTKLTLAVLIGLPIPIISLILLKSAIDYFSADEEPAHEPENDSPKIVAAPGSDDSKFDRAGNLIGAKQYDKPAVISENAVMSSERKSEVKTPEPAVEAQLEPAVESEPETEPEAPAAQINAPGVEQTHNTAVSAQSPDAIEKEIAPNNYEAVKKEMTQPEKKS